MQDLANIIECYNKTAKNYADKYGDELAQKHFDKMLLKSFVAENFNKGKLIDLGCGPGQTTKYLAECGLKDLLGVDLSTSMVEVAKNINPELSFETADMLDLKYPDGSFGSAIAFYSIVHFDYEHLKIAFKEIKRILSGNAQFLFSFHIGDNVLHLNELLDHGVNIDFYFFDVNKMVTLIKETGFELIDVMERQPYPGIEYPSKRAYIWAQVSS